MGSPFASARIALGNCDRCGFQYLLRELRSEVVNLEETGVKVCLECWDPDNPQTQLGRYPVSDPQAVRNPRPTGSTSGRLIAGTLSYDFEDSVEGFTATNGSLTHDSGDGYAVLSMAVSGSVSELQNNSVAIDTSLYRYVRMRFSFASLIASPEQKYLFSWRRSGEGSYESAMLASNVDLYVNGSDFHEIYWDTRDGLSVAGIAPVWTGTLDRISFSFLDNDPDSTSSVEIDWIRFEPGYLDQGV
jgi:hypothetical protein